jgi:hypothetical protein
MGSLSQPPAAGTLEMQAESDGIHGVWRRDSWQDVPW